MESLDDEEGEDGLNSLHLAFLNVDFGSAARERRKRGKSQIYISSTLSLCWNDWERGGRGLAFLKGESGLHYHLNLKGLNLISGPACNRRRKKKCLSQNPVSKRCDFDMVLRSQNLGPNSM